MQMLHKLISTSKWWATIPIRLGLGSVFMGHGAQKVLGSFGGPGFNSFISGQTPFPFMRPAWLWLAAAALSELIGGILILLGLFTRIGALLIACIMLTAVFGVHLPAGFFLPKGYEYAMVLLAISLALLISGGGALSVDLALSGGGRRRR
jgi:putative oxidoreductase